MIYVSLSFLPSTHNLYTTVDNRFALNGAAHRCRRRRFIDLFFLVVVVRLRDLRLLIVADQDDRPPSAARPPACLPACRAGADSCVSRGGYLLAVEALVIQSGRDYTITIPYRSTPCIDGLVIGNLSTRTDHPSPPRSAFRRLFRISSFRTRFHSFRVFRSDYCRMHD